MDYSQYITATTKLTDGINISVLFQFPELMISQAFWPADILDLVQVHGIGVVDKYLKI